MLLSAPCCWLCTAGKPLARPPASCQYWRAVFLLSKTALSQCHWAVRALAPKAANLKLCCPDNHLCNSLDRLLF